ncbi:MFS transporter [uncultured Corynebacterium sp.]|uniref:MFS transporter n=1 Tax=uncultured Corynebacterium sp. TaxID=159447 RepID=UPI0025DBA1DD|nr:MFS transporter [uncultured Corynebacterium sp.]
MADTVKKGAGLVLLFGMFQVVLGSTVPSGLYAIYEREWDLTRIQTTLVFAAYVAGVLFSLIFLGGLADRFGRKPAILFSVVVGGLSSITFLAATGLPLLVLARFLSGASVGACTGAFTSALNDYYGRTHGSALSAISKCLRNYVRIENDHGRSRWRDSAGLSGSLSSPVASLAKAIS